MRLKRFIRLTFKKGNTITTGLRGTGKDMLTANVIARRKKPYISNVDYNAKRSAFIPLKLKAWDVKNNYDNFIKDEIVPYDYPYPEECDFYVSDAQLYFPSQEFSAIERKFPNIANFQSLSRHLASANVHCNTQNLDRLWNKIKEQADIYIRCEKCLVIPRLLFRRKPKWVIQVVTVYDKAESCQNRVKPFKPLPIPLGNKGGSRAIIRAKNVELKRDFDERNGSVKRYLLIYKNKSNYDTRLFKTILKGGGLN